MGRNARPSVLKRDRERRKAEKAAKKRDRREQRKSETVLNDVVSLDPHGDAVGSEEVLTDAPNRDTES